MYYSFSPRTRISISLTSLNFIVIKYTFLCREVFYLLIIIILCCNKNMYVIKELSFLNCLWTRFFYILKISELILLQLWLIHNRSQHKCNINLYQEKYKIVLEPYFSVSRKEHLSLWCSCAHGCIFIAILRPFLV